MGPTTGHRVYLAAYYQGRYLQFKLPEYRYFLESYHYLGKSQLLVGRIRESGRKVFLDSGAFSAWNMGVDIDLKGYAKFIKDNQDVIEVASVLDGIGDPALTLDNQKALEDMDVAVLPCFHYGEPWSYLEDYLAAGYEYITLGGMVPISTPNLLVWLDEVWERYLTDDKGMPVVKVHGFGLTVLSLMLRYPWYSVDSTSWVATASFGSIYWPTPNNPANKLVISDKSNRLKDQGRHFDTYTAIERDAITAAIRERGYDPEELRTLYWMRDQWNIDYFASLCDRPLEPFVQQQLGLFQ